MKLELENKLFNKYSKLFNNDNSLESFDFDCGDGWYWLIDNLCSTIQSYIDSNSHLNIQQVTVLQVKQKFGELRFYTANENEFIQGMIWFAENLSHNICENCGSTKNVTTITTGWIINLCEDCKNKEK